jgi:hypothetical protein
VIKLSVISNTKLEDINVETTENRIRIILFAHPESFGVAKTNDTTNKKIQLLTVRSCGVK